jgi:hypothetical protein
MHGTVFTDGFKQQRQAQAAPESHINDHIAGARGEKRDVAAISEPDCRADLIATEKPGRWFQARADRPSRAGVAWSTAASGQSHDVAHPTPP